MNSSAPELRVDPITGRTVIVARGRADRPHDFRRAEAQRVDNPCPFCRGHEAETPPPLASYGGDSDGWLVRVIPNKYPVLSLDVPEAAARHEIELVAPSLARPRPGYGAHEVIVESARHVACFSLLDQCEAHATLCAYRDRLRAHAANSSLRYAQVFKNVGLAGGASIEHVHSQLIATPFVPLELERELAGAERFYRSAKHCVYCRMIESEAAAGLRQLRQTARFSAFCPFAGRVPYETWILPRRHEAHFHESDDAALAELACLLRDVVGGVTAASSQFACNYFLHAAPFDMLRCDHYHWHIELFPRTTELGGFEWASGCYINPLPPEQAAPAIVTCAQAIPSRKTS